MAPIRSRAGRFVTQQPGRDGFAAFVPAPLPPQPSVEATPEIQLLLERANRSLGRLDGLAVLLPDPTLFLYMYVRKEAVLSSQIEGTQSTLSDLLLFEHDAVPGAPMDDVRDVSNYIAAMDHGLTRLRSGFPVSLRLLREIHGILLRGARGNDRTPGEFRRSQNWIGGSRPGNALFVPPPPHEVMPALDNLEKFLHAADAMPLLFKAGLAHAQFETIHPFLDGNGRLGRLLITFMLCAEGALAQPLLYLSLYLKERRDEYYASLQRIRTDGDWEQWLLFFLTGVDMVAVQATETARRLIALFDEDRARIQKTGRSAASTLTVHDHFRRHLLGSAPGVEKAIDLTLPTVLSAIGRLQDLGILREVTGQPRNRQFVYQQYLDILNAGLSGQQQTT